ncbi:hypothetical protein IVB16_17180 [Bradyrhizobium sp. 183]|uniref:hypothetical protein n=1 Tax=unclassified Bradyrhizobium TaxID=2631580 RepID=UPI001FFB735F|nr:MULTISPECIES: hypothetical protein [unclassified Bradyrhizobium]MCK1324223.1 hypothetical protein [Bradyrhizobium sp. 156]MCK1565176.1 hypothetical protein [Bradyrhizobium sp. 173]UPJ83550.1 hypothetical protein IVB17_17180 [Bradyrhizobium sp. 184]UPJ91342.1 hypothetical protein IVB16_17180 [Bradyrhizobium sp. 183]
MLGVERGLHLDQLAFRVQLLVRLFEFIEQIGDLVDRLWIGPTRDPSARQRIDAAVTGDVT